MASDIDSTSNDDADLRLSWSGRWTLGQRILAVNVLTILLVALSTLYLDVFRNRLSKERVRQTRIEATATAAGDPGRAAPRTASRSSPPSPSRPEAGCGCSRPDGRSGRRQLAPDRPDLRAPGPEHAELDQGRRPGARPRLQRARRREIARRFRRAAGRPARRPGPRRSAPNGQGKAVTAVRNAPDLTPVISAAVPIDGGVLLATDNDRAFTRTVRSQRGADRHRDGGADR